MIKTCYLPRVSQLDIERGGIHTISLIAEAELANTGSSCVSGEDSAELKY